MAVKRSDLTIDPFRDNLEPANQDPSMLDVEERAPGEKRRRNRASRNRASVWIDRKFGGLEAKALCLENHAFRPHTHDTLMLGLVTAGCISFTRGRATFTAPAGTVSIVNPLELHTGERKDGAQLRAISLNVPSHFLCDAESGERDRSPPHFRRCVVADIQLQRALVDVFCGISQGWSSLTREVVLTRGVRMLVQRYSERSSRSAGTSWHEPHAVRRARELIDARYDEELSIAEIAADTRLSRFQLMRAFRRHVGAPIHVYQIQRRIERAKKELVAGHPVAQVAINVGFADQSHFTKRFRGIVGMTPGAYRRDVADIALA